MLSFVRCMSATGFEMLLFTVTHAWRAFNKIETYLINPVIQNSVKTILIYCRDTKLINTYVIVLIVHTALVVTVVAEVIVEAVVEILL